MATYLAIFKYARRTLEVGEKIPDAMLFKNWKDNGDDQKNKFDTQRIQESDEDTAIVVESVRADFAEGVYIVESQGDTYVCVTAIKDHTRILIPPEPITAIELNKLYNYMLLIDTEYLSLLGFYRIYGPAIQFQKDRGIRATAVTDITEKIHVIEDRWHEKFIVVDIIH